MLEYTSTVSYQSRKDEIVVVMVLLDQISSSFVYICCNMTDHSTKFSSRTHANHCHSSSTQLFGTGLQCTQSVNKFHLQDSLEDLGQRLDDTILFCQYYYANSWQGIEHIHSAVLGDTWFQKSGVITISLSVSKLTSMLLLIVDFFSLWIFETSWNL